MARALAEFLQDDLQVVYVVDTSGSMGGEPLEDLKLGLERLRDKPVRNTAVALVEFNSASNQRFDFTERDASEWDNEWNKVINSISAGGSTNMYAALRHAIGMLPDTDNCPTPSTCRDRRIVLMSDGHASDGGAHDETIKVAKDKGVKIDTVAFGYGADETGLKKIADETSGKFKGVGTN